MSTQAAAAIRTERLLLRPLTLSDAGTVAEFVGDWDVARMTGRIRHPYSIVDADAWIASLAPDELVRAIDLDGRLVGAVGYVADEDGSAEIGYWVGKPYWGHGLATEAATALVDHCFRVERRPRLTCCHFVDNLASARIIAKLGFERTGQCNNWCEARRTELPAVSYERRRPRRPLLAALSGRGRQTS